MAGRAPSDQSKRRAADMEDSVDGGEPAPGETTTLGDGASQLQLDGELNAELGQADELGEYTRGRHDGEGEDQGDMARAGAHGGDAVKDGDEGDGELLSAPVCKKGTTQ